MKSQSPAEVHQRLQMFVDGLRYAFSIAVHAATQLRASLDEISRLQRQGEHSEPQVISAIHYAWTVVDMCHRVRDLIQSMPGMKAAFHPRRIFLDATLEIEELRHHVQHFRSGIGNTIGPTQPLWGVISWAETGYPLTSYTMATGALPEGTQFSGIAFDLHEFRHVEEIAMIAGGHRIDLLEVCRRMTVVHDEILRWLESRGYKVTEGKTLISSNTFRRINHGAAGSE